MSQHTPGPCPPHAYPWPGRDGFACVDCGHRKGDTMTYAIRCGDCDAVLARYEGGNRAQAEQLDSVIFHQCAQQARANKKARALLAKLDTPTQEKV
jgi:hypothetical protein